MRDGVTSFADFWPRYLRAHSHPRTRAVHYCGTVAGVLCLLAAIATGSWPLLVAAPIAGYAPAMISHPIFERNVPLTFTHPLWSLRADFTMLFFAAAGRLRAEIMRAGA